MALKDGRHVDSSAVGAGDFKSWNKSHFGSIGLPLPWDEYVSVSAHSLRHHGCSGLAAAETIEWREEICLAFSRCASRRACTLAGTESHTIIKAETPPLIRRAEDICKTEAADSSHCRFDPLGPDAVPYLLFFTHMKRRGYFFEMGANKGAYGYSNSLVFEKALGWSGHLVEASPSEFAELVKTRANSSTGVKLIQKCAHPTARTIELMNMGPMSTLSDSADMVARNRRVAKLRRQDPGSMTRVECAPLDELTAGIGPVIDIMFLDCEGCELGALTSFSWHVPVHVINIEKGKDYRRINEMLLARGFEYVRDNRADRLFVNSSWLSRRKKRKTPLLI